MGRAFPPPSVMPNITKTEGSLLNVSLHPPSKAKIVRALKQLKSGKVVGPDAILPEALKINPNTTTEMLRPLFHMICKAEKVPSGWNHGITGKAA